MNSVVQKLGLMKIALLPEGYLQQNIVMQKQADFVENSGILDNPFA